MRDALGMLMKCVCVDGYAYLCTPFAPVSFLCAGGGLTLALAMYLRDIGKHPLPAACVMLSPWADLLQTGTSLSLFECARECHCLADVCVRVGAHMCVKSKAKCGASGEKGGMGRGGVF